MRRGQLVEAVVGAAAARAAPAPSARTSRTNSPSARPSSSGRPGPSPCQNGILPGWPGAGRDDDPLVGDVLDAPRAGAEQERLARPALVDHLLVELADPGAVGQEHAEQAAVGDGAAAGDGQALRAGPAPDDAGDAVPHDAGPQLGELVGRVAARPAGRARWCSTSSDSSAKWRGPAHQRGQLVDRPLVERAHGHDLLGQHVERVARVAGVLDEPVLHALHDDRRLDEVGAVLGEELAPARLAHLVAGPADALQAPRHRAGRLDLDDQVDRTHVDAELERAGGDQALELAPLELVLDLEPPLARQRAVVGLHQLAAGLGRRPSASAARFSPSSGQLVEAGGQPLGQAAGVDEDEGGAVLLRPARAAAGGSTARCCGAPGRPRAGPSPARR